MSLKLRIINIDYYVDKPHPLLDQCSTQFQDSKGKPAAQPPINQSAQVPIIRLFGVTSHGQKACLHIHQVYPYIYIPFAGTCLDNVDQYMNQLGHSINHAVGHSLGNTLNSTQAIMAIHLVKGIKYYGFHHEYSYFLKIYILNPQLQNRIVALLEEGALMDTQFEVYDNYQYLQQFMIDYNLFGMDFIELDFFKFRMPVLEKKRNQNQDHLLTNQSIPALHQWNQDQQVTRHSFCELELDTWPGQIVNRTRIKERHLNALVSREKLDSQTFDNSMQGPSIPLVPSLAAIWDDEQKRRIHLNIPAYEQSSQHQSQREPYIEWKREQELRESMLKTVQEQLQKHDSSNNNTDNESHVCQEFQYDGIPTSFQGISMLHPPIQSFDQLENDENMDLQITHTQTQQSSFLDINVNAETLEMCTQNLVDILAEMEQVSDDDQDEIENIDDVADEQGNDPIDDEFDTGFNDSMLLKMELEMEKENISDSVDEDSLDDYFIPQIDGTDETMDLKIRNKRKMAESKPPRKRTKVFFDTLHPRLPRPVSVDNINGSWPNYILQENIVGGMWSPEPIEYGPNKSALFHDPPRPTSPTATNHDNIQSQSKIMLRSVSEMSEMSEYHSSINLTIPMAEMGQTKISEKDRSEKQHQQLDIRTSSSLSIVSKNANSFVDDADQPVLIDPTPPISKPIPNLFKYFVQPPSTEQLVSTLSNYGLPGVVYTQPFVTNRDDAPLKTKTYGTRRFNIPEHNVKSLKPFQIENAVQKATKVELYKGASSIKGTTRQGTQVRGKQVLTLCRDPPSFDDISKWLIENPLPIKNKPKEIHKSKVSQLENPTMKNKHGFKFSQSQVATLETEKQYLSILSMELHAQTSGGHELPDPVRDPVVAIFFCFTDDDDLVFDESKSGRIQGSQMGIMAVKDQFNVNALGLDCKVAQFESEFDLFKAFSLLVRKIDPDILCGWEIQSSSWGYLIDRSKLFYQYDYCEALSRLKPKFSKNSHSSKDQDQWGSVKQSHLHSSGRIFLNIWRIMRKELKSTSYTIENVVFHVLHKRIPRFEYKTLSQYHADGPLFRWRVFQYYMERVYCNLDLLSRTEWVSQTSEFARVYGIELFSVVIRGSQFKVQSVMARIARPENFIMYTPSRNQVKMMRPIKALPLNMEPKSRFYTSPMLVLDFQSLYPSLMIAYNICYSTLLGYVKTMATPSSLGALRCYEIPPNVVVELKDHINVTPNGMVFVKPHIRKGTMGRMVQEILDTRIMVKQSMKLYKENKALTRILQAKQLGLKLLANVTYGYAAASFSGKMPCSEIADAIVESGRATLERGIDLIRSRRDWEAKVVYADTDSLFVSLPGKSKADAFRIGYEIVSKITDMNPIPMKLQFEKVYLPCILLAKKRYVGFKYETIDDNESVFDAKGIETVRRDGCPAVVKCVETCIKILFRTKNLSLVKEYLYRQWTKILSGRVSIQDFIIAKEVKLGTYKSSKTLPLGAIVAEKEMIKDPRAEPEFGDRVPYVVINGKDPNARLRDSVVSPEDLVNDQSLTLNGKYYITKQIIPPLARIFRLVGVNIEKWFNQMPKVSRVIHYTTSNHKTSRNTLEKHFKTVHCLSCENITDKDICNDCFESKQSTLLKLTSEINTTQERFQKIQSICRSCTSFCSAIDIDIPCTSTDCPVFFVRSQVKKKFQRSFQIQDVIAELF